MDIKKIKIEGQYQIFPIDKKILERITEDMKSFGYDKSTPIITWNKVVIDGHTRLQAAKKAEIDNIPIFETEFKNKKEAIEYAIHNQRDRRNLTDAILFECVSKIDMKMKKGERTDLKPNLNSNLVKDSATKTGKLLGIGRSKITETRTVIDHADEKTKEEVIKGEKTIHQAYTETQEKRKEEKENIPQTEKSKPIFNQTNENIEWAKWTWNPVTGCKHNCKYCYARDIANRFYKEKFKPTFRPKRLTAPKSTKIPESRKDEPGIHNTFVCSMADLFGDWVSQKWIDDILNVCDENPQWNYLFLTKNPKRLIKIDWPKTAWIGTTIDIQSRVKEAENTFSKFKAPVKFFSCEPLQEELTFSSLKMIDWIIIGGRSKSSGMKEGQPKWKWVERILNQARQDNVKVYFKPNLEVRPKEYPNI